MTLGSVSKQQITWRNSMDKFFGHRPALPGFQIIFLIVVLIFIQQGSGQSPILTEFPHSYIGCYTPRTDSLKELFNIKSPLTCIQSCEHQSFLYAVLSGDQCFCSNTLNERDRQNEQLCNNRCLVDKTHYCGGVNLHSYYITSLGEKEVGPKNIQLVNATEHSLIISWDAYAPHKNHLAGMVSQSKKQITNFIIKTFMVRTYSSLPFFPQPEFIVQSTERRFEITDLHPATEYNITVKAICDDNVIDISNCGSSSFLATTQVGEPSPSPKQPRVLSSTNKTITVEILPIQNDNGPLTKVLIIVERLDNALSQPFDTDLLGSWQKAQDDGLPYYIAAELDYLHSEDNRTKTFVVGDDRRYGRYTNPPLDQKDGHVHVSLGLVSSLNGITKILYTRANHDQHSKTMDDFTYATFDSGQDSIIALVLTCVIFGICLTLSIITYFYLRYKTCQNRGGINRLRNAHEMTLQQPIVELENNGFIVEDEVPSSTENFDEQLNDLVRGLDGTKRLPRSALRMNVNEIIGEGSYGEVITGKLVSPNLNDGSANCQLHAIFFDELTKTDQSNLLRDLRKLTRLQPHQHILEFYGVSASADWVYFIFEHQPVSLKQRLVESRRGHQATLTQRLSTLSEELVLQWIYEIASAMEYMSHNHIVHKQLCSHNIFVTEDTQLKVSVFGPIPYTNNQSQVDISRWLAPETLRYQNYSPKSDVWSFACVAWECCALGGTLYANINTNQLLLESVRNGLRPIQPVYIYQDMYQLLLNCWQTEPSERISFDDITFNVRQLMTSARHAICFDAPAETVANNVVDMLPYYLPMLEIVNN